MVIAFRRRLSQGPALFFAQLLCDSLIGGGSFDSSTDRPATNAQFSGGDF